MIVFISQFSQISHVYKDYTRNIFLLLRTEESYSNDQQVALDCTGGAITTFCKIRNALCRVDSFIENDHLNLRQSRLFIPHPHPR